VLQIKLNPFLAAEQLRVGCDLMNLFFIIDEYSDVGGVEEVRQQKDIVMDALRNPHKPRPKDEWIGGEVTRQWVSLFD
jgi:Delta6-protoilludene synthase